MEKKETNNSENNREEYQTISSVQNGQNGGFSKGIIYTFSDYIFKYVYAMV